MRRLYILFFIAFSLIGVNRSEETRKDVLQVYGREGQSFYLKKETPFSFLKTTQKPLKVYLDLAILMDTTSSIQKNLETYVKKQFYSFLAQLFLRYPLMRIAVAAFRDKNILPFGLRNDYCYKKVSPFSNDIGQVAKDFLGLTADGGGDVKENPLEAMLLTVNEKVGLHWRKEKMINGIPVLNFLLVLTDATYKTSDYWENLYKSKGIFRAPNGPNTGAPEDCNNREYPTEKMVADALNKYNIFPIFCVPSQRALPYETLKTKLHNGRVSIGNLLSKDILSKLIEAVDEEIQRRTKTTKIPEYTDPIHIAPPKKDYIDYVVSKGGNATDLIHSTKEIQSPNTILTGSTGDETTTKPVTSVERIPPKPTTVTSPVPTQNKVKENVSTQKPSMTKPSSITTDDINTGKKKETLEPKKNKTNSIKKPDSTVLPDLSIENGKSINGSKPVTGNTPEKSIVTDGEKDKKNKIEQAKEGSSIPLLPSSKENKLDSKDPLGKKEEEEEECARKDGKEPNIKEDKNVTESSETVNGTLIAERESEERKRRRKIAGIIGAAIGGSAVVGIGAWQIAKAIKDHQNKVANEEKKDATTGTTTSTIIPDPSIIPPVVPSTKPNPTDPTWNKPAGNVPSIENPLIPIGGWGDHNDTAALPPIYAGKSGESQSMNYGILGASIAAPVVLLASVVGYIMYRKRRDVEKLSSLGFNFGEEYGKLLSDEVNVSIHPKDEDFS